MFHGADGCGRVDLKKVGGLWLFYRHSFIPFRSSAPSFDSFILVCFILLSASFLPLLCLFVSSARICYRELTAAPAQIISAPRVTQAFPGSQLSLYSFLALATLE